MFNPLRVSELNSWIWCLLKTVPFLKFWNYGCRITVDYFKIMGGDSNKMSKNYGCQIAYFSKLQVPGQKAYLKNGQHCLLIFEFLPSSHLLSCHKRNLKKQYCQLMCRWCHLNRALNVQIGAKCRILDRPVARSENPGGLDYCGGHNLPPWLR